MATLTPVAEASEAALVVVEASIVVDAAVVVEDTAAAASVVVAPFPEASAAVLHESKHTNFAVTAKEQREGRT